MDNGETDERGARGHRVDETASQKCARGQAKSGSGGAGSEHRRTGKKAGREQVDITHEKHVKRPTLTDANGAVGARQAASERVARKRRDA